MIYSTKKQIIQRKRNWEKRRIMGIKASIGPMLNDKKSFTQSELKYLSEIKIKIDNLLNEWKNKR